MFTKKIYSDIRLVGAPPSSIGKFGADTDNWMWPRHTGDFSVFRVYADANGNPAPYSDKMLKDPAVRIQYASKYAGSTNAYKNAIGSNWAIKKRNFEQMKKEEQDKLIAWSNKMCEPSYPDALMAIEQIVSDRKDLRFRSWITRPT